MSLKLPAIYPFSAVVGQDNFKLALQLTAINPAIGGVLVSGPRGSAKSTLARAMAELMPNAAPFVTLPLGASLEMVTGSIDLEAAMQSQSVAFNPGLLAKGHNGILYVDEVNLLQDSLVDVLLDVSASGINTIERDGLSHSHPAKCLLLGTMNPDEGELRPQLQDRFGLSVELSNSYSIAERVEIVQRREAFDIDSTSFIKSYSAEQSRLQAQIIEARQLLPKITCDLTIHELIAERCLAANVDGLRADIVWLRAAKAYAALTGLEQVTADCIDKVEELVLSHRRQAPSPPPKQQPPSPPESSPSKNGFKRPPPRQDQPGNSGEQNSGDWGAMSPSDVSTLGDLAKAGLDPKLDEALLRWQESLITSPKAGSLTNTGLKAKSHGLGLSPSNNGLGQGDSANGVDWFQTLRHYRAEQPKLYYKASERVEQIAHMVLLDTSASGIAMAEAALLPAAKQIVMQLARRAYLAREQLVLWGFGGDETKQLLSPRRAPKEIEALLDSVELGGGTPFLHALQTIGATLPALQRQRPACRFLLYVISDGCTTANADGITLNVPTIMIDTDASQPKRGRGQQLAQQLNAQYLALNI